ncbi:hypothetical protein DEH81_17835 [Pectobacterium zantedeschiae]|uniref:Ankyrin repeat domain-containing protein n=2 Tax=Pectobacterium zantedeschiae TaxID=2034769 RepID=A0A9X8JIV0_9GAMM|nr:hypothetical protein DEH81_17835 [Pectobacterium zantedeschiae]RYC44325.1 ankyrin repeat domain-containing protein [Pectobacterium zantedeschiae]RYC49484.1 hypothetical protein CTN06_00415 [Pectobacterium zantedeschiae]
MKRLPAEQFFSGSQLMLAHAIERSDSVDVKDLAGKTDLNKPGAQDMTILFFALQSAYGKDPQQLAIMAVLVGSGADPLQQIPDMGSVAEVVARSDDDVFMKALIDGGMSPNSMVEETPIIFDAAYEHSIRVLKYLTSKGANINLQDSLGQTVLTEALSRDEYEVVIWLLQHGADPRIKTKAGWQFSHMLEDTMNLHPNKMVKAKLEKIRELAVSKGMVWPPVVR